MPLPGLAVHLCDEIDTVSDVVHEHVYLLNSTHVAYVHN